MPDNSQAMQALPADTSARAWYVARKIAYWRVLMLEARPPADVHSRGVQNRLWIERWLQFSVGIGPLNLFPVIEFATQVVAADCWKGLKHEVV